MRHHNRFWATGLIVLAVAACSTLSQPFDFAETPEQKAFALYGEFTILEEEVAELLQIGVPQDVGAALIKADSVAKPAADLLLESAVSVSQYRAQLADTGDPDTNDKLNAALSTLLQRYSTLVQRSTELKDAIRRAK